jgi:outer membrane lipoprotein LolB
VLSTYCLKKQTLCTFILVFFLAGCGTLSKPTVSLNSTIHQLSLKQQESWLIKGKIGFKSSEKNQSANFRWQQNQQQYQLNLTSVIGTSLLNLKGDKKGVTLTTDDETYQDSDPSYLIWRVTGWQIPVEKLRLWIKGQHQKNDEVLISGQGWINQLQPMCNNCKDWLINYDNYKLVDGIWLPHKVLLQNNNNQLIIRVNKWELHE